MPASVTSLIDWLIVRCLYNTTEFVAEYLFQFRSYFIQRRHTNADTLFLPCHCYFHVACSTVELFVCVLRVFTVAAWIGSFDFFVRSDSLRCLFTSVWTNCFFRLLLYLYIRVALDTSSVRFTVYVHLFYCRFICIMRLSCDMSLCYIHTISNRRLYIVKVKYIIYKIVLGKYNCPSSGTDIYILPALFSVHWRSKG